jgi:RluA family pseudouridine synthase
MPTVLWRDRDLLAIDKPAGMLSQPSERAPGERSADQIVLLALAHELGHRPFVRLVHRLDRPTSGVLLFATDPAATKALATAWERGLVRRTYLALVDGNPPWDERVIDAPIGRPDATWRFAVDPAGEPATTKVRVLERRGDRSLVTCELVTGRTHQVRVHLSSVGHPVLGDTTYGGPPAERVWLHAAALELPLPRSRERVTIASPFPQAPPTR